MTSIAKNDNVVNNMMREMYRIKKYDSKCFMYVKSKQQDKSI